MGEVFALAISNSVQLQLAANAVTIEDAQTKIQRLARLPELGASLDFGYISNADIWTPGFKDHQKAPIPHDLTTLSFTASQLVFRGNQVNLSLAQASLAEQVAKLKQQNSKLDIRLLVAAKYLEILRLFNQGIVFDNNLLLAKERLKNIKALFRQGMVTENDVLRTELIISDYELALKKIGFQLDILNGELNKVIGKQPGFRLIPDTSLTHSGQPFSLDTLRIETDQFNPQLKIAGVQKNQAVNNVRIAKSGRLPELSLFAGSSLQRPFLYTVPALNIYFNIYEFGLSLRYNISSIYQSRPKITAANLRLRQAELAQELQQQQVDVAVSTAHTRYLQAGEELKTNVRNLGSAEENFRIVEKKYFNQLSLLTDLIDATNIKIDAELNITNSRINREYTYYQLLYAIGKL